MASEHQEQRRDASPQTIDPIADESLDGNQDARGHPTATRRSDGDRGLTTSQEVADSRVARSSRELSNGPASAGDGRPGTSTIAQEKGTGTASLSGGGDATAPLVDGGEASKFRERWQECQQHFVDEPRASVEAADELVAEVMQKVASQFAATRESLEQQWGRGDSVSTEDLRVAMQRYRDFFNRLLAA